MKRTAPLLSVVLATVLGLSSISSAVAQDATPTLSDPVADAIRARGEAYRPGSDAAQTPEELRLTSALNAEIAAQNDLAENQERALRADYAKAQAEHQAELNRLKLEAERIAAVAAEEQLRYQATLEAYAQARANWEACQHGDRSRCTPTR